MKNKTLLPHLLTIVFSVLLVVLFFIPMGASDTSSANDLRLVGINTTSLLGIESALAGIIGKVNNDNILFAVILGGLLALNSVLTLLFAALKKGTPTIVFSVLSLIMGILTLSVILDDLSLAEYLNPSIVGLLYIALPIIIVGLSVWLIIAKIKAKKAVSAAETQPEPQPEAKPQQNQ